MTEDVYALFFFLAFSLEAVEKIRNYLPGLWSVLPQILTDTLCVQRNHNHYLWKKQHFKNTEL